MNRLRIQTIEHSRKRNGLAHVLESADPGDRPLDAHAEAAVRHAAVAPQVEVPFERVLRQVVLLDTLWQWAPPVKCPGVHKGTVWIDAVSLQLDPRP